jgi:hypothetical protein
MRHNSLPRMWAAKCVVWGGVGNEEGSGEGQGRTHQTHNVQHSFLFVLEEMQESRTHSITSSYTQGCVFSSLSLSLQPRGPRDKRSCLIVGEVAQRTEFKTDSLCRFTSSSASPALDGRRANLSLRPPSQSSFSSNSVRTPPKLWS